MISPRRKSSRATERLLPGQISYLKKRAECNKEELLSANISDGCFDHLVLILSTNTRKARAEALILTSFGGKTLEERHPYNRRIRLFHLPIAPAPRHPDNGILLELDGDLRLPKETYVKTELPCTIPWSMLRPNYRDLRSQKVLELKPRSFAQLLQYVDAGIPAERKPLKRITTARVNYRGPHVPQRAIALDLPSLLRNMLLALLVMVFFYVTLLYLQCLWDRITHWVTELTVEYLGSWYPFQLVEGG